MHNADEPANLPATRSRWKKLCAVALWGIPLAFALSQPVIWGLWNPGLGDSLKNLITYSQIALGTLLLLIWWFTFAPVSRAVRLGIGLPVVLLIVGWIASIRSVEFSGDMALRFHHRWQPAVGQEWSQQQSAPADVSLAELQARPIPELQPEDVPEYRGQHRDGWVVGPPLNQNWQEHPPAELWRRPVGGGYASVAILGDFLTTLEQRGPDETIACYDALTGRELWKHTYPADFFEAMGGAGPRSTPTIAGDAVYSFGAFGDLCCLDLQTGALRWHVNSLQQFGVTNTEWGMSCSPLVHENHVIVNIGGTEGNALIAYDNNTGALGWHSGGIKPVSPAPEKYATGQAAVPAGIPGKSVPGYSSPQLSTLAGQLLILNLDGVALRGHDPATGRELWSVPFANGAHVNVAQPVVFDDGRIFISASYDVGSKMVRVSLKDAAWKVDPVWENRNLRCKFTSPVLVDNFLYGLDEGILVCLDAETGKRRWKGGKTGLRGRYEHGQILATNKQILALTEQGEAVLIQPSHEKLEELAVLRVLPVGKNWNPLQLCRGRLYVRNSSEMACYDLTPPTAEHLPTP